MEISKSSRGGFTLLEIMVSLAVVGGLLVTLLYSLNYHLGIAQRHEFMTIGTMLAKNKLTELEAAPISAKGDFLEPYASYRFSSELKKHSLPGISELSVTVSRGQDEVRLSRLMRASK